MDTADFPLELSLADAHRLVTSQRDHETNQPLLLDCREQPERQLAAITPSLFVPMSEITTRLDELAPHRAQHLIVYCHHGGRSLRVAEWLRSQGFTKVQSMQGGIDAWAEAHDPSMPRY